MRPGLVALVGDRPPGGEAERQCAANRRYVTLPGVSEVATVESKTRQPALLRQWIGTSRLVWRLAAIVATTVVLWGCLNLDSLVARGRQPFEIANTWVSRWARAFFWIFGVQLYARGPYISERKLYPGRDDQGVGRVFVLNHHSSVDIPIALHLLAAHAISRHDVANWPLVGRVAKRLGTLFVDRRSRRSGAEVLKQVDATLADGEGVVMFPEGTSFRGDEVRPFRPGAFKAAQRAGSEIVPLGVAYEDEAACYYHELFTTHLKRIAKRRSQLVAVVAGEPIPNNDRDAAEMKELVHQRVQELTLLAREELQQRVGSRTATYESAKQQS